MKYTQVLLFCMLMIGSSAYAQLNDVARAFEHPSADEIRPVIGDPVDKGVSNLTVIVYPNPSKGGISTVNLRGLNSGANDIQISVIDNMGMEFGVRSFTSMGVSFTHDLAESFRVKPGVYSVKVVANGVPDTKQWVVQ